MYEKTMICLANSRKPPSGRCIAGKEFEDGEIGPWLRPVSARPEHEVSEEERRYEGGKKAQLLDIIEVPLKQPSPLGFQVENHVLDAEYYWVKIGSATWDQVQEAVDPYDAAFWSKSQNTYHGMNDKVSEEDVAEFTSSLKLIHVHDLVVHVQREDGYQGRPGKRKVRGHFNYRNKSYWLSISDAHFEEEYLHKVDGQYPIEEAVLCISLVEVFHGFSFRVIASVITPQRCEVLNGL